MSKYGGRIPVGLEMFEILDVVTHRPLAFHLPGFSTLEYLLQNADCGNNSQVFDT